MRMAFVFLILAPFITTYVCAKEANSINSRLEALEKVKISGSFRMNYSYRDFNEGQRDREGDFNTNVVTLGVDTEASGIRFSAQYRWYNYMDTVHHMYIAMKPDDTSEIQIGVMKVPFGILPYESNNYWFGVPYYLGLNDDYDSGIKYATTRGQWNLQAAFYVGTEYSGSNTKRYSIDVINDGANSTNEETNQLNFRATYSLPNGELGVSTQYGQLYNNTTKKDGDHWAAALHHKATYGKIHTQFEVIRYEFNPENPAGISDDSIVVGAFSDSYEVASKGNIYVFNISYDVPVSIGSISNLNFYNDYSVLDKNKSGFKNSKINTLGVGFGAGDLWVNIDFIMAKNMLYLNGGRDSFTSATASTGWNTQFNINAGYYF